MWIINHPNTRELGSIRSEVRGYGSDSISYPVLLVG